MSRAAHRVDEVFINAHSTAVVPSPRGYHVDSTYTYTSHSAVEFSLIEPTLPRQSSDAVRSHEVAGLEVGRNAGVGDRHDAIGRFGFESGLGSLVDKGDVEVAVAVAWRGQKTELDIIQVVIV